ncbi:ABC-2 type transport system permease protein [Cohnella sp. OV330]|uniref:ABC transporter permease n=1 Tax=Cohnella sp. OV330 TaxID=1855288 RepID=UPI0008DFAFA7|nr:ABC transporter permease [Cohnella sp. OV330]SFA82590.1 ABC-2 type transport system permease protein [Cohnella sp. OV330]
MNSMRTVIAFTMRNKLRSKSFIITTIILGVLLVVGANVPYFIDKLTGPGSAAKVGYVNGEQGEIVKGLEQQFGQAEKQQVQLVPVEASGSEADKTAALEQAIDDGKIKGYLTFTDNQAVGFPDVVYHSKKMLDSDTSGALQAGLQTVKTQQAVRDANLTDEQFAKLMAPVKLDTVQIADGGGKTEAEQGTAIGLTYAILILLFMSVMITGQLIATEITAEKSSRVMEIIVTSVAPLKQMFGKVIGTFLVGLLQLVVLVGASVINLTLPHNKGALERFGIDLSSVEPKMIIFAIVMYLLGYFLYAMLFAAIGSLVSRTEDLSQTSMPVTMLSLAGFYIAIYGLTNPDSSFITVCSFIPFFSPFILFLRIGLADPAWWEIVLSVGILIVSVLAIGWLAAKIYRVGVLMYGKKPSFKEVFKALKAYKV